LIISGSVLLRIKYVAETLVDKIKTHFKLSDFFSLSLSLFKNRAAYEMMWNNIVEPDLPQMSVGACSLHAGYLRLQTPSEYVIRILVDSVFIK
jgi:hypothetical protein